MTAIYRIKLSDGLEDDMRLPARVVAGKLYVFNGKWTQAEGSLKPERISGEWVNHRPLCGGWFWLQQNGADPEVARVRAQRAFGGRLVAACAGGQIPVDEFVPATLWSGPITEPSP